MTQLEAEFVQREAPPSYGQLIAQGLIPPVEDFPVYNPAQVNKSYTAIRMYMFHTQTHTQKQQNMQGQQIENNVPQRATARNLGIFIIYDP